MVRAHHILLGFAFVALSGCAINQKITYPLNDVPPHSGSPFSNVTLAVKPFEDQRQPAALEGAWDSPATVTRSDDSWFYNSPDHYKDQQIAPSVTKMIAQHLDSAKLFRSVSVYEGEASGATLVLEGKIKKFDAFKKKSVATQAGQYFGMVGILATAGAQSEYEATTALIHVRLIHVSTQKVIWEGDVEGKIHGMDYADPAGWSVYQKANLSLKQAVDDLIVKLTKGKLRFAGS